MSSVTLDQSSIEQLKASGGDRVQIRDPQGNVVGIFQAAPKIYKYGEMPDIPEEELKRRFADPTGRMTTEEVLRKLGL